DHGSNLHRYSTVILSCDNNQTWRTRVGHVSTIHTSGWMGLLGTVIVISSSQKT
ncbi:hypothetical protein MUK42_20377, partial [Musa troglodytarum]